MRGRVNPESQLLKKNATLPIRAESLNMTDSFLNLVLKNGQTDTTANQYCISCAIFYHMVWRLDVAEMTRLIGLF